GERAGGGAAEGTLPAPGRGPGLPHERAGVPRDAQRALRRDRGGGPPHRARGHRRPLAAPVTGGAGATSGSVPLIGRAPVPPPGGPPRPTTRATPAGPPARPRRAGRRPSPPPQ